MTLAWLGYAVAIVIVAVVLVGAVTFLMAGGQAPSKESGKSGGLKRDTEKLKVFEDKVKGEFLGDSE